MNEKKPDIPKKGAGKRLRELYEKTRGNATPELLQILKAPPKDDQKKSAKTLPKKALEI